MSKENNQIINSEDLGQLIIENTASATRIEPEENDQMLNQGDDQIETFSPFKQLQWICSCGAVNIGPSCSNCGASKK